MRKLCQGVFVRAQIGVLFSAIVAAGISLGKPSIAGAVPRAIPDATIHVNAAKGDYRFTSASHRTPRCRMELKRSATRRGVTISGIIHAESVWPFVQLTLRT